MIDDLLPRLFALLIYPGLLMTLVLGLVVGRVLGGPASGGRALQGLRDALAGRGPFASAAAVVLALVALALLPWPAPPWQPRRAFDLWLLWGIVEASALAAVLHGLLSPSPTTSRAAVREAQLGLSGRLPIWLAAAATLLARGQPNALSSMPLASAVVAAALAALLSLPAAAGWPPFGAMILGRSVPNSDMDELADQEAALAGLARRLLSIFWIALLATVFTPLPRLPWWAELLMRLGLILAVASIARGLSGLVVRRTLPAALRWCWWIALPLALVAVAIFRS